jgi:L-lysine exporter family protein LysE/ArgO
MQTSLPLSPGFAGLQGLTLGLSLIVAIGAQNAFVLRQGLRREHVGAVVAVCAVLDALLILAGIAGLAAVLGERPGLVQALTLGGAVFLAAYGLRALWRAWRPGQLQAAADPPGLGLQQTVAQALAFTLLNPHVYLDTVLLVGSIGGQHQGSARWAFASGACVASLAWFGALGYGARWLAPVFARPRAWQVLDALIGLTMLLLSALLWRRLMLLA